uniref:Uncharacterized protein n=1 Tax=uncultured marine thaumarchaeote KM3_03_G08 TaxID=1455962 RepID=A0A075G7R5_9ARCH|nr:hypothetical protein [uncultured marine thaumarchaeote KM3_03_G08]
MSKKPIIGGIILAAIIGVIFVGAEINPDNPENTNVVFHVTLADAALYDEKGLYHDFFTLEKGVYEFRFVANGASPQTLSIELWNITMQEDWRPFSEDFILQETLVEEELSSWYVWDYLGEKRFHFDPPDDSLTVQVDGELSATIEIVISPNRNYDGPVSVDLIKLR